MKILINQEELQVILQSLCNEINEYYGKIDGENLVLLPILKGASFFATDLSKLLGYPKAQIDFVRLSSYKGGTQSQGSIDVVHDIKTDLAGKDILIIDEIIDSGRTIEFLIQHLKEKGVKTIQTAALLDKREKRVVDCHADFVGKVIPDAFVVGYGLDYNEMYRTLPYIAIYE